MTLDTDLIVRRRTDLGLSHRTVAAALGVTAVVVKNIENGTNHGELTIAQLTRLADTLAVDLATLLAPPDTTDRPETTRRHDDAAVVGSLLVAAKVLAPTTALADATGWPLPRVHAALDTLADLLPVTGQRLRRHQSLVGLARAVVDDDSNLVTAVVRRHIARDGVSASEVRMLRRIDAGTIPKAPGNADTVALGTLTNAGLAVTDNGTWSLADDVRYSLLLD